MSTVHEMKRQVSMLEHQAAMNRIAVSTACKELMEYCIRHQSHDILVTGISNSENPLRESKTCVVL